MENQQMAMPAEMAPAGPNPEEMAIYEQMRQQISPQEFSNEMLAGASQIDPQAVAEFTEELRSLDVSPEELDALNDLVDEILANPEQYAQIRQKYLAQGLPEDILPEQFDPNFFAAMNMAVDQMIAAPTGVQAFAQGGIAELKPIAKAIASYGRNGDTMLAHITPAEARMLRRRGGSGTINPSTGLPEFFLKKAFKSIGKAVKKFASSTVGRLVTTVALGFFLGPMAVQAMGLASGTMAAAAVSGFVGGAGSSLLAGGNLKDALKSGAIAGLTAGATAGLQGARLTGAPVVDAPMAVPGAGAGAGAVPGAPAISATGEVAGMMPTPQYNDLPMTGTPVKPFTEFFGDQASTVAAGTPAPTNTLYDPATATRAVDFGYKPGGAGTTGAYKTPTIGESFSKMGEGLGMGSEPASFDTFKQGATDLFSPGPTSAQQLSQAQEIVKANPGTSLKDAMTVVKNTGPGFMRTYGPATVAGLGTMAAFGGFDSKPVEGGDITKSLMKSSQQRMRDEGTQRLNYLQNLPGVVYDRFGEPIAGQNTRFPTYDVPDYDFGGFNSFGNPSGQNQGIMNLPSVYIPPPGTIGSRRVEQPYNNADMYSNLMPRGYDNGGEVVPPSADNPPSPNDDKPSAEEERLASERLANQQRDARNLANQKRAQRKAAGSGQMYANINAGLSALAPENFPGAPVQLDAAREAAMRDAFSQAKAVSDIDYAKVMQQQGYRPEEVAALSGRSFGDINRRYNTALRQDAYAPMLQGQQTAMDQQAGIAASGQLPRSMAGYTPEQKGQLYMQMARQGMTDPQIRAAAESAYGVQTDSDWAGLQGIVSGMQRPITTMPVAPPGTPDFSNDPGARVGPGMSYTQDQMPSEGGISIQGGFDEYGKLYGSEPYHYGRGPKPGSSTTAQAPAANPYSNITNPQPGYTGPNLYAQTLAMGMPSRDAMLPAYQYTPLAEGATRKPTIATPTASSTGDMARKQAQYQALLGQGATDAQIRYAGETMFGPQTDADMAVLQGGSKRFMNMGGIAGLAKGGYPRRNGQISGPGTEKSDSIPAMLSDGEFVMTAKAVRGAGKGSRRAGAKQMYKLMHQLEKNAERG